MIPLNTPSEMIAINMRKAIWTAKLRSSPVITYSTSTDNKTKIPLIG
ncbi:hypothetical protein J2W42_002954 [Rhizobium tibeticum]|nr:hypothetical protein [Rhizobium tibeticum]